MILLKFFAETHFLRRRLRMRLRNVSATSRLVSGAVFAPITHHLNRVVDDL